jgi:hypothetical protein
MKAELGSGGGADAPALGEGEGTQKEGSA